MTQIHEVFLSPPITRVGDDIDPEISDAIIELHEYGYIYRWLDDDGECRSATWETPPNRESSTSQSDSWMRYKARFPDGPLPFPERSWQQRQVQKRALEGLHGKEWTDKGLDGQERVEE